MKPKSKPLDELQKWYEAWVASDTRYRPGIVTMRVPAPVALLTMKPLTERVQ